MEGRGEESPVKEDGCSGKKAPTQLRKMVALERRNQSYKT